MARISEGKNGHTKSEANTKVLALNEIFIQYSDAFFLLQHCIIKQLLEENVSSLGMIDYGK